MDSIYSRVRLGVEIAQLRDERALLHEEMHIKDLRMAQIPPQKRPRYRCAPQIFLIPHKMNALAMSIDWMTVAYFNFAEIGTKQ